MGIKEALHKWNTPRFARHGVRCQEGLPCRLGNPPIKGKGGGASRSTCSESPFAPPAQRKMAFTAGVSQPYPGAISQEPAPPATVDGTGHRAPYSQG